MKTGHSITDSPLYVRVVMKCSATYSSFAASHQTHLEFITNRSHWSQLPKEKGVSYHLKALAGLGLQLIFKIY